MQQRCPDCQAPEVLSGRGNGECAACYGLAKVGTIADEIAGGKRPCSACHGTGQCQTCGGTGLVLRTETARPHANSEINPFDDKVAVRTHCPNCGTLDWFEWNFLGRLTDPVCGCSWYTGSGVYTAQLSATFELCGKFMKYFNHGVAGEGAWVGKLLGGFMGIVLGLAVRLPYGVMDRDLSPPLSQSRPGQTALR